MRCVHCMSSGESKSSELPLKGGRTIVARLQGEDKPSPLLWTMLRPARSIVGAMACPRPARATASLVRTQAHCKNRTRTPLCWYPQVHLNKAVEKALLLMLLSRVDHAQYVMYS